MNVSNISRMSFLYQVVSILSQSKCDNLIHLGKYEVLIKNSFYKIKTVAKDR